MKASENGTSSPRVWSEALGELLRGLHELLLVLDGRIGPQEVVHEDVLVDVDVTLARGKQENSGEGGRGTFGMLLISWKICSLALASARGIPPCTQNIF
jgi:hypothetical protein